MTKVSCRCERKPKHPVDCADCHTGDDGFRELIDKLKDLPEDGTTLLLLGSHLTGKKEYVCAEWFLKLAQKQLGKYNRPLRIRLGVLCLLTGKTTKGANLIKRAMSGVYSRDFTGLDDPNEWLEELRGLDRIEDLVYAIENHWPTKRTKEIALKKARLYLDGFTVEAIINRQLIVMQIDRIEMEMDRHMGNYLQAQSIVHERMRQEVEVPEPVEDSEPEEVSSTPTWDMSHFTSKYTLATSHLSKGKWRTGVTRVLRALDKLGIGSHTSVERKGVLDTRPYVLTDDDIIQMRIKATRLAQIEMEEAGYHG